MYCCKENKEDILSGCMLAIYIMRFYNYIYTISNDARTKKYINSNSS